jgi:signal transduction histidine kinase
MSITVDPRRGPDAGAAAPVVGYGWIPGAILLAGVSYAIIALVLVVAGAGAWTLVPPALVGVVAFAMLAPSRTRPHLAGLVVMTAVWCELTHTIYNTGYLEPTALLAYPVLVVAAGLLLSERGAIVWALLTGLAIPVALLAGRAVGHRPSPGEHFLVGLVVAEVVLVASTFFVRTIMRLYRQRHAETEHQRRKFAALFAQVPDCLMEVDGAGRLSEINMAGEALFGAPRDYLVGRPVAGLFAGAGFPGPDLADTGGGSPVQNLSTAPGTSPVRHLEVTVRTEEERGHASLLVVRDVTTRRVLAERQAELQRLQTVGRLAAGIAHDFNNLLTAIGGHAGLLQTHTDPEVRQFAGAILSAQQRGAKLTQQMLSFAQSGYREPRVILIAEEMLEWSDLFRRVLGRETPFELKGEGGCYLEADRVQLEQVLLNLLANARDASPSQAVIELQVARLVHGEAARLGSTLEAARQVMFAVVDRGPGIAPEVRRHLFEPFFTTKAPGKGTGMGLAATYGLVAQNHGCIAVDTEVGRGTTVRVFFPERPAPART